MLVSVLVSVCGSKYLCCVYFGVLVRALVLTQKQESVLYVHVCVCWCVHVGVLMCVLVNVLACIQ